MAVSDKRRGGGGGVNLLEALKLDSVRRLRSAAVLPTQSLDCLLNQRFKQ